MNAELRRLKAWLLRQREEVYCAALDLADVVRRRRQPLVPPRRRMFDGPRDPEIFLRNGREFQRYYVDLCGLEPEESVLDVGSGIGRKTLPLTRFLSPAARYVGLDVHRPGVEWCRSRISSRFPNFEFQHIDVFNRRYNPRGTSADADYRFPFPGASFDFVVMGSVFTHMLPAGVEQYLRQTARVLRPASGRCLISFFLLNADAAAGIAASRSQFRFSHRRGEAAIEDPSLPEDAVAYDESYVHRAYAAAGLRIERIHPGSWCGRESHLSFQDLVVARLAGSQHG